MKTNMTIRLALSVGLGMLGGGVRAELGRDTLERAWEVAVDRAAVTFNAPNGPACFRTNRLWNGSIMTNRFTTGRPEYVMPFGAGDLSAMASFGADTLELHLSSASWLTPKPVSPEDPLPQFKSPGHVSVRFADLRTNDFTRYALTMDMRRGRLLLDAATARGPIRAEMFGDRASGALVVEVEDGRADVAAPCVTSDRRHETLAVVTPPAPTNGFRVAIGLTPAAARQAADAPRAALTAARDRWWRAFWARGSVRLEGDADAALLERAWHVNLYSYANVGFAEMPPKFNGGPGIVFDDVRCWGRDVWWQNTRELIWPMAVANHADFARRALAFLADCLPNLRRDAPPELASCPGAVVLSETMCLLRSPLFATTNLPPYDVTAPYRLPSAAERAEATRLRRGRRVAHTSHVFSSGTELLQQMVDYVRFTGDRSFLPRIAAWLRSQTELYLLLLEEETDGRYHVHATNVNESWFLADDSCVDLAAARICLSLTSAHGRGFGFPETLVAAADDRLARLADYPRGRPYDGHYSARGLFFAEGDEVYHPCRLAPGMRKCNSEMNELYLVHPFAMSDVCGTERGRAHMKGVFPEALALAKAQYDGGAGWGWLPIGVAAARYGLPEAAALVADHARRTCRWPYGGGKSPGAKLYLGAAVEDTVYLDGSSVVQTGVQELLMQSHADEPSSDLFAGGPVRFLPAGVPKRWKGAFRLLARGGFLVEATFSGGRVTGAEVTSLRGGTFVWIDPSTGRRRARETSRGERFSLVTGE